MPAELGDLFAVQQELLTVAVESLDAIPVLIPGLEGAPDRQGVVGPGAVALDCDQVVVYAGSVGQMSTRPASPPATAGKKHVYGRIPEVTLFVLVSRCCLPISVVQNRRVIPPSMADQEAAAEQLNADGWALFNGIFSRLVHGQFLDRCSHVEWNGMVPVGPSGRCGGWQLTLTVRLAGFLTEPAS